jgi:anti-anti-sigma regulatory factor
VTVTCLRQFADGTRLTATLLEDQAGLRLRGEADMLSTGALREAIAALPADAREVHLDLAELTFIDVSSTRELLALARRPPRPCLILHQPPPSLTRLIRLLWPDCHQLIEPAGSTTGNRPTVSIQAA